VLKLIRQLVIFVLCLLSQPLQASLIFEYGDHTYKIITEPATWEDASVAAAEMTLGNQLGYLAQIDSESENAAILEALLSQLTEEQLAASLADDGSDVAFVWLGGSDAELEGQWVWSSTGDQFWEGDFNGTAVADRYTNWGVQPDSATGKEDALAMSLAAWPEPFYDLGVAGQWNDLDGATPLIYVVEFDGVSDLSFAIEEPAHGETYSGVGMVRGWAVSSDPIERIEVFVDGEYRFDIPYGGKRDDVGEQFAEIEGADKSGYTSAVNYSGLGEGEHEVTVRVSDSFGSVAEQSTTFDVTRFHQGFIGPDDEFELGWAITNALGRTIRISGAVIANRRYNLTLQWRDSTQSFEIISIDPQYVFPEE